MSNVDVTASPPTTPVKSQTKRARDDGDDDTPSKLPVRSRGRGWVLQKEKIENFWFHFLDYNENLSLMRGSN